MQINPEIYAAGSILLDGRCLSEVSSTVNAEDFSLAPCQAIYRAAVALYAEGEAVDPVAIRAACAKAGEPVSSEFLVECMDVTCTAANAELYARLVREDSLRRSIAATADTLKEMVSDGGGPKEALDYAAAALRDMDSTDLAAELEDTRQSISEFLDYRDALDAGEIRGYVPSGLKPLDKLLGGGFLCGGLFVIGARPGTGKTTLGLWIVDAVRQPALFVSLEMGAKEITAKRLARETGISYTELLMGKLDESDYKRLADGASALDKIPVTLNRKPGASVQDIARMARKIPGLRMIVVDYLGLLRPENQRASRYEQITGISNDLKRLARTLNVPVVALAQLNRESVGRQNRRPSLSDLRDSGAIEQDADAVLLLHNEARQQDDPPSDASTPELVECILAKNRHGQTGKIDLSIYFQTGRIFPVQNWR